MNIRQCNSTARLVALPALLLSSAAMAGVQAGTTVGAVVGTPVGQALSGVLGITVGSALPAGLGGAAAITGLALIIGVQLIKRHGRK